MTQIADKARQFAALHHSDTFIMPNFWDPGSAVILEKLGFPALASTSAGFAQTLGRLDGQISLAEKLDHLRTVASLTQVPISADFEDGFADDPQTCAHNLLQAAATGIAGASIEDWSRTRIHDFNLAVERIAACAEARATLDYPFQLTARAENLLHGVNDLDDTIRRLQAYADAGADVLYAPGLANDQQIADVVAAVDKPVNVLVAFMPDKSLADYAQLGVRRLSLGSALANYVIGAQLTAAGQMLDQGSFAWMAQGAGGRQLRELFS